MAMRVLIADDHALVRLGIKALLEAAGFDVVGEAAEGREALRLVLELQPDVLLTDVTMPGLNGIDLAAQLRDRGVATRVVVVSMHSDSEHVYRAFAAGAAGYVIKSSAGEEVVDALDAVAAGRRYLGRGLEEPRSARAAESSPLDSLSSRERQVLQMLAEGHAVADIATTLSLSPKTVETYRARMMEKLGIHDFATLVKFAIQHGVTSLE